MLTEEFNNTFINTFCAAEHIFCCDLLLSWLNPWFDTIHTDKRNEPPATSKIWSEIISSDRFSDDAFVRVTLDCDFC